MITKEMRAELLVKNYTPIELAMIILDTEEMRMEQNQQIYNLNNENMFLRDKADYMSYLVDRLIGKGGTE